jgi:hypothetical protein
MSIVSHGFLCIVPIVNEMDESTPVGVLFIILCISVLNMLAFEVPTESPIERQKAKQKIKDQQEKLKRTKLKEKINKRKLKKKY